MCLSVRSKWYFHATFVCISGTFEGPTYKWDRPSYFANKWDLYTGPIYFLNKWDLCKGPTYKVSLKSINRARYTSRQFFSKVPVSHEHVTFLCKCKNCVNLCMNCVFSSSNDHHVALQFESRSQL